MEGGERKEGREGEKEVGIANVMHSGVFNSDFK